LTLFQNWECFLGATAPTTGSLVLWKVLFLLALFQINLEARINVPHIANYGIMVDVKFQNSRYAAGPKIT
jgi:hypothetical protein